MTRNEAIVNWWADKLKGCKHSGLSAEERRDPANNGYQMAEMLMTIARPKVTDEQVEAFKTKLLDEVAAMGTGFAVLSVDYGPNLALRNALEAAKVSSEMGTLPIKTCMWIHGDKVDVRYGYGAEVETIWKQGQK